MKRICLLYMCSVALAFVLMSRCGAAEVCIEISAGDIDRADVPVYFSLDDTMASAASFELKSAESGELIPVQLESRPEKRICWMLEKPLSAGQTRKYVLQTAGASDSVQDEAPKVAIDRTDEAITIRVGEKPVLTYHIAVVQPPAEADPCYARSGFIHPLYTPSGKVLTQDFPADHWHQHGVFFAWVHTTFKGREVDFWNQGKKIGNVTHVDVLNTESGDVFAKMVVRLSHVALDEDGNSEPVLDEIWAVKVYRRAGDDFLMDFTSVQRAATDEPLTLNEYHYGGMGFRGNSSWLHDPKSDFLTSEGKSRNDGNHTRPTWVDAFGPFDDAMAGVTIMDSPENFRYPQPVRLHPEKPYFCFAPMVEGEFEINRTSPCVSNYRLNPHDGTVDAKKADLLQKDFAQPMKAKVVPEVQ